MEPPTNCSARSRLWEAAPGLLENNPNVVKQEIEYDGKSQVEPLVSWELYVVVNQPIPNAKPGGRLRFRFDPGVRGIEQPIRSSSGSQPAVVRRRRLVRWSGVRRRFPDRPAENLIEAVLGEGDRPRTRWRPGQEILAGRRHLRTWPEEPLGRDGHHEIGRLDLRFLEVWAKRQLVGEKFGKNTTTTAVMRTSDRSDGQRNGRLAVGQLQGPRGQGSDPKRTITPV